MKNLNERVEKVVYSIPEVASLLGISKSLCYDLAAKGRIPVIHLGVRRVVVPKVALERMLNER